MEACGSGFSSTMPPVFDGENYQAWAVKMSAFMEGSDLWEAVKGDYEVTPLLDNHTINQIWFHKESITRKAKAKSCLYAAVSPFIFNGIMKFPTAKDIWNFLKIEYEGDEKIRGMKALNLMREFERQQMKENEAVKDFSDRLINLANRIRVLGTDMKDDRIMQKILVSLPERFEATIVSLENTKDLSDIRLAELLSALEAQEQRRLMRREVPVEAMEGALPARSQMRASGREKKSWNQQKGNAEGSSSNKGHAEQRHPSESGSTYQRERFCQAKDSRQDATEGAANNEVELMFTASCFATGVTRRSWLVDSGCTHHMSYDEKSFANLDRSFYAKVKIGNGDYIDVEGRGDVVVDGLKGSTCFSWCSKKQEIVAQSTTEAEFVAAKSVVNQAIWLRKLLNDMSYIMEKEIKVSVDNQAALAISKNPVFHGKTKHFNVKYYYLREVQQMGEVELIYCTTEDQLADIFTKSFHQSRFVLLREKIGVSISASSKEEFVGIGSRLMTMENKC
ncbi:hypothetical protein ZIOFF_050916 [Zingiber officinale]|uniref:Retrovirus-related Pol polyprotein from transposon TNT 1-94-like beta-barrel domain-containing protein n=1 Tax=Zingiber officinale TaxID=94328 RepID=A0A8J5FJN6_ZINOF|nr:hypothetical protein ZIOFF_050916 [Zingiber officinale]